MPQLLQALRRVEYSLMLNGRNGYMNLALKQHCRAKERMSIPFAPPRVEDNIARCSIEDSCSTLMEAVKHALRGFSFMVKTAGVAHEGGIRQKGLHSS